VIDNVPTPKVSVIIAAFNAAPYIGIAIDSALASRDVAVEVIVVDDESTDETWQVLEGFGDAIRKVRQPKGGPYKARNLGVAMAHGDWIAFLDADDYWAPEKLARQLEVADQSTALVYTDAMNVGDLSRVKPRFSDSTKLCEGDIFEALLLGNFITLSSVLIRKSWFDQLRGFGTSAFGVQDWDLWLRLAAHGNVVKLVCEPLTYYRIHNQQMTRDLDQRAHDRMVVVQQAIKSERGKQVPRRVVRQAMANVWEIGAWQAAKVRPGKAIAWYLRAARHWPWKLYLYKQIVKCCLGRA